MAAAPPDGVVAFTKPDKVPTEWSPSTAQAIDKIFEQVFRNLRTLGKTIGEGRSEESPNGVSRYRFPNGVELITGGGTPVDIIEAEDGALYMSEDGRLFKKGGGGAGTSAGTNKTYLTENNESADLPNSRQVLAGNQIAFDDSVANTRTVSLATMAQYRLLGRILSGTGAPTALDISMQTYVPVWTAVTGTPAVGDGTLTGRYLQIGQLVFFSLTLTIGSTTNLGTGTWIFTLPITAFNVTTARPTFPGYAQDSGGQAYAGMARASSTTTFRCLTTTAYPGAFFSNTQPFAWTSGAFFTVSGCYEAA